MFNLTPGHGLGSSASRELAFGLGAFVAVEEARTVSVYGEGLHGRGLFPRGEERKILFARIARDDEEILGIIIESVTSGVVH